MSPSLSIFASDPRAARYLAVLAAIVSIVLLLNMATSLYAIRNNWLTWHFAGLFAYQTQKLKSGPPIDILLIGDSSLGNAIDARAWGSLNGQTVVNAALTGAYGYAGSLQMLRRAHSTRGVSSALIVQTPDILMRRTGHEGILFSAGDLSAIFDVPLHHLLPWLLSYEIPLNMARRLVNGPPPISLELRTLDYVPQGPSEEARSKFDRLKPLDGRSINAEITLYLRELSEFCNAKNIRCVYAHGPVAAPLCSNVRGYYTKANSLIRMTGLELLADLPPCLNKEELGDSTDHVAPANKDRISRLYHRMYLAWLAR